MTIDPNLTRQNVLDAIAEYDRLGQQEFLKVCGRRASTTTYLHYENKTYDSKAIVGFAHQFLPDGNILKKFFGGEPVKKALKKLGFEVVVKA